MHSTSFHTCFLLITAFIIISMTTVSARSAFLDRDADSEQDSYNEGGQRMKRDEDEPCEDIWSSNTCHRFGGVICKQSRLNKNCRKTCMLCGAAEFKICRDAWGMVCTTYGLQLCNTAAGKANCHRACGICEI